MRRPSTVDFIGIGGARCGTTWLTHCLRAHPQLCLSEPKEVRYFNRRTLLDEPQRAGLNPNHTKPLDWYLAHFRHSKPGQLNGECSPVYLYDEEAAAAIYRTFPCAKLIVCLRNPIDRAYSHYWLDRGNRNTMLGEASFEEALERYPFYLEMGRYARQLKRYLACFPREQLLLLFSDDMKREPASEVVKALYFLGVEPTIDPDVLRRSYGNAPTQVRSPAFKWFLRDVARRAVDWGLSPVVKAMRRLKIQDLVRAVNATPLQYPEMRPETRQWLREALRQDIRELEAMAGRDLSHWR